MRPIFPPPETRNAQTLSDYHYYRNKWLEENFVASPLAGVVVHLECGCLIDKDLIDAHADVCDEKVVKK